MTSKNKIVEKRIEELQAMVKSIKGHIDDGVAKELTQIGIDVNPAIYKSSEQMTQEISEIAERQTVLKQPKFIPDTSLTSELIYLMGKEGADPLLEKELYRRLDLLGLTSEQKSMFIVDECDRIEKRIPELLKYGRWVTKKFITENITRETLPKPKELTLSELILIIDDANHALQEYHEWLPDQALNAIEIVYVDASGKNSIYYTEFLRRVKNWGWSEYAFKSYNRNECLLTKKLKWHYDDNPAWQKSTMFKK